MGCMILDLTGQRFSRLLVISQARSLGRGRRARWWCRCDCGQKKAVHSSQLRTGGTRSCGCLRREVQANIDRTKHALHGHSRRNEPTPTYIVWKSMRQRCHNPNNAAYPRYGGRGITICSRWENFETFLADMGERPNGKGIERRDNAKGYSPGNCYWATAKEQANNTRSNRLISYRGKTLTLSQWGDRLGMLPITLAWRLKRWPAEKAFSVPLRSQRRV